MTPTEILKMVEDNNVRIIDFKFMDFPGTWQHFSVPTRELTEESFEEGFGFDGSSIRGWQAIHESDMLVLPDPTTAFIDPFEETPTLSLTCTILDPITKENYTRDPRSVALKCEKYLASTGIADTVYLGPEAEFFVFDHVSFDYTANRGYFEVDSHEGIWNSGASFGQFHSSPDDNGLRNLGHRPRHKEGYFPVPPTDTLQALRTEMTLTMEDLGLHIEAHHHEVATAGQCEIDLRYDSLTKIADKLMIYKYVVKNVAARNGKTVTFMPKPLYGDNGSGMHTHLSFWKDNQPLFAGDGYAGLSEMALWAIGGILKHAASLIALTNPTTNSYKRLVPGYEAPVNLAYSQSNRSAAIRIPMYSHNPKAKRIEFRTPDPTCNPYLAFSALTMAALDGVQNKIDPGDPLDKDIYDLPPEELANVPQVPGSLDEALIALEKDHEYLLRGEVFTEDVITKWIEYKRKNDIDPIRLRPHPYEFFLYYDM